MREDIAEISKISQGLRELHGLLTNAYVNYNCGKYDRDELIKHLEEDVGETKDYIVKRVVNYSKTFGVDIKHFRDFLNTLEKFHDNFYRVCENKTVFNFIEDFQKEVLHIQEILQNI